MIKYIYVFYSNQQKLFPGNRKKQVGLHAMCVGVRLPKNRAKSCLVIWTENWQCYKKITCIEKAPCHFLPVGEDKGYSMERGRIPF